jgi:hypothetical protein
MHVQSTRSQASNIPEIRAVSPPKECLRLHMPPLVSYTASPNQVPSIIKRRQE